MPRKIIIDTDPGQDDAVAILLALASPEEIEVLGITAVAGRSWLASLWRPRCSGAETRARRRSEGRDGQRIDRKRARACGGDVVDR